MQKISNLQELTSAFLAFAPAGSGVRKYKLERMRQLMAHLGNPQNQLRVIHIAGTSGKTSTAYFLRGMLEAAGQKTGLTVSPHVVAINERVQVSGVPLEESKIVPYAHEFLRIVVQTDLQPTYFELLIGLAYWVFKKEKVTYAVIETGLGGLMDGTNVVSRPDKVCVITDVGLDHTEILGETIEEIAAQKAGIIQAGNRVFVQDQDKNILNVIAAAAEANKAPWQVVTGDAAPDSLPIFQRRNWAMAEAAFNFVRERDKLPAFTAQQRQAIARQTPPGRLEVYEIAGKKVILDGAHNPQKLLALRKALTAIGATKLAVIANLIEAPAPKIEASLAVLKPLVSHLIIPEFYSAQDVKGKQSLPADELSGFARHQGITSLEICAEPKDALGILLDRPEPVLLVTGSLYLVGQIRSHLAS